MNYLQFPLHSTAQRKKGGASLTCPCSRFGKLPLFFTYFTLSEHTYNIYLYNSSRTTSCCLHRFRSVEGLLWGAEPRFELGPAFQQFFKPTRYYLCHAAPQERSVNHVEEVRSVVLMPIVKYFRE